MSSQSGKIHNPQQHFAAKPPLKLNGVNPVASGGHRLVFAHPEDPSLVLKVVRNEVRYENNQSLSIWRRYFQRYKHYNDFAREATEHIASYVATDTKPPFVQQFYGFIETDMGLAAVSRAERDKEGEYALNLYQLLQQRKFDSEARRAFDDFASQLFANDIVVGDLRLENIVYSYDANRDEMHFVIIDGLGDKNGIPICSVSKTYNRLSKKKRIRRIRDQIATFIPADGCQDVIATTEEKIA